MMTSIQQAIFAIIQEFNLKTEDDAIFAERVSEKMRESFSGYNADFSAMFANLLPNTKKISSPIEFQNIAFISYCKHHMTPIIGHVSVFYTPRDRIVGLSRVVECINAFARRLQLQEEMTVEIAECLEKYLQPVHVRVEISAKHYCMQKSPNDALPEIRTVHIVG